MKLGLINQLSGRPGADRPAPSWDSIRRRAVAAENAGFDTFVFEDVLLYPGDDGGDGAWESMTIASALAVATDRIELGQSVVNSLYRSPGLTAKMAATIDEISGGRYVLGIGSGNTDDYDAFGIAHDHRYSRFAEAIRIIYDLLETGAADFAGEYYSVTRAETVLQGPRRRPPINIAAGSPKMIRLAARYGDYWDWWVADKNVSGIGEQLAPLIGTLDRACEEEGRDPATLGRTLDLYLVVLEEAGTEHPLQQPITGSNEAIADQLLTLGELGFSEIRCDVFPRSEASVEAMTPIVELVHAG